MSPLPAILLPRRHRPVPWRLHVPLGLLLPLALAMAALAARCPEGVERLYGRGAYPLVARTLAFLTGWAPFTMAEVLLVVGILLVLWRLGAGLLAWRRGRRRLGNLLAHAALQALGAAGVLALAFVLGWGLNYHRVPLATRLDLDLGPPTPEELRALASWQQRGLERLEPLLAREADGTLSLEASGGLPAAGEGYARVAGEYGFPSCGDPRPKRALLNLGAFLATGVFVPFTGEPLVARDVPVALALFTAAHESGHQKGFAREEEASFAGLVACAAHPRPAWRYAGLLQAHREVLAAWAQTDPEAVRAAVQALPRGVRADLKAQNDWSRRHDSVAARGSQQVYGRFLRAQGQSAGIRSYHLVLGLVLGDWRRAGRPPGLA